MFLLSSFSDFRGVGDILRNLSVAERERLFSHVRNSVRDIDARDLAVLLPLLANNAMLQKAVMGTVVSFITNELQLQIID